MIKATVRNTKKLKNNGKHMVYKDTGIEESKTTTTKSQETNVKVNNIQIQ